MKLIWLSEANLRDKSFIHELAHHFDKKSKAILVHDSFGSDIEDTRFVTKRISAVLSEMLVVNFAQSGEQRNLFSKTQGELRVRTELIENAHKTVNLFISNSLLAQDENTEAAHPDALLSSLRAAFPAFEPVLFPSNSRSPLGRESILVSAPSDAEKLLSVYEEESEVLRLAAKLAPSRIASPASMWMK